jgi:hypothetical protein
MFSGVIGKGKKAGYFFDAVTGRGTVILIFFFQICDGSTGTTIMGEDSTKIRYAINRNLRFVCEECFYDFFNSQKCIALKYGKVSF